MPAWPGGPCPHCGENLPPMLVHCRNCRALLNEDLHKDSVEIPAFFSLPELDSLAEIAPAGVFTSCPSCEKELKIAGKYLGRKVQCKHCAVPFWVDRTDPRVTGADLYSTCPHCTKTLRFAAKYKGCKVACRFCSGKLLILSGELSDHNVNVAPG